VTERARICRASAPWLTAVVALAIARPVGAAVPPGLAAALAPEGGPETPERRLLRIYVNDVDQGVQVAVTSGQRVTLPRETLQALRIDGDKLELPGDGHVRWTLDYAGGTLYLWVPSSAFSVLHLGVQSASPDHLSEETWATWVNYDANARTTVSGRTSGEAGWGGDANLIASGPDFIGSAGWAYDSDVDRAPVRLNDSVTWRPASLSLAVTAGDATSDVIPSVSAARPLLFGGIEVGTDHSGQPSWTSSPIASVAGTAQAQSSLDLYVDGLRELHSETSGGPYQVDLPPGIAGQPASLVITDVTGRKQIISIQTPVVEPALVSAGTFLWSAGAGLPRYGFGNGDTSYQNSPYAWGGARYGWSNRFTAIGHAEGGSGFAEGETGFDSLPWNWLGVRALVAASRSANVSGGQASIGTTAILPWGFNLDISYARASSGFRDIVADSGLKWAIAHHALATASLPQKSSMLARLDWQVTNTGQLGIGYQRISYPGSYPVTIASATASLTVGGVPFFAELSRAGSGGGRSDVTGIVGVTLSFGAVSASASAGYSDGTIGGNVQANRGLGFAEGDYGWNVNASRSVGGPFVDASAQVRTGYGIPGIAYQEFGGTGTASVTMQGTIGQAAMHPFVADPVIGGVAIVQGGAPGLPVTLNGNDKGRTGDDGMLAVPLDVAEVPLRLALDVTRMPIEAVPGATQATVTVRQAGATLAHFATRSARAAARVTVTLDGKPPPLGSTLMGHQDSAPLDESGRAWLPAIERGEVLTVSLPDGGTCRVHTGFDGHGNIRRRIGPLPCTAD
jgi:outer membrane usher protein